MQKISWLVNNYLLSIFFLILGILSFFFNYLFFIFFLLVIFFIKKNYDKIILIAYILGIILATKQSLKENVIEQIAARKSTISAQIKNITKINNQKIDLQKISINEKINPKFIPNFFYTKDQKIKIGNIIKFSLNKNFKFWQNYLYVKKNKKLTNFFSLCNTLKEKFDKSVSHETKKICDAIFWGYNTTGKIKDLYCLDKLGCQHLMARSGLHLTPINTIFFLGTGKISSSFGIIMMIFYAMSSATSFSFWRAIMITILVNFWRLIGYKANKKIIFCQSFLVTTIFWPEAIFAPSFQLSFALVAALYFLDFKDQEINIDKRLK